LWIGEKTTHKKERADLFSFSFQLGQCVGLAFGRGFGLAFDRGFGLTLSSRFGLALGRGFGLAFGRGLILLLTSFGLRKNISQKFCAPLLSGVRTKAEKKRASEYKDYNY